MYEIYYWCEAYKLKIYHYVSIYNRLYVHSITLTGYAEISLRQLLKQM